MPKSDDVSYTVPVSPELDEQVRERMRTGGFSNRAEYVRATIRADLEREAHLALQKRLMGAMERGEYYDPETVLADLQKKVAAAEKKASKKR